MPISCGARLTRWRGFAFMQRLGASQEAPCQKGGGGPQIANPLPGKEGARILRNPATSLRRVIWHGGAGDAITQF